MTDDDDWSPEIIAIVKKYALQNAVEYNGSGKSGSVLGRILGERTDLRSKAKELKKLVETEVNIANEMALDKGVEAVRKVLEETNPEALNRQKQIKRVGLKELPNAEKGKVVLRFAPNPNGPLTLGHARGVTINSEYSKIYEGKVVLRFDDTDSKVKPPIKEAYGWIESDYEWLTGKKPDIIVKASERMDIYLEYAEKLLRDDFGYVCKCSAEKFKKLRDDSKECPCRSKSPLENLSHWKLMNDGTFDEGDAVVRVKTSMDLPNPALRDWPALRIQHSEHPMVGNKYKVWPLLDFQSAIEDYEQGVTHIIRGKDLMDSTRKQTLLYAHFGWDYPETLYWGRVKIHEFGSFSTSGMRKDIENKKFTGWDDPRLPTLRALRRRGFDSDAMRDFWIDLGLTQKDISVSLQTIEAFNSSKIDERCERRAFVRNPELLKFDNSSELITSLSIKRHPMGQIKGERIWDLNDKRIYLEKNDIKETKIRLKDFADIRILDDMVQLESYERSDKRKIVHWLPVSMAKNSILTIPKGNEIIIQKGMIEDFELKKGDIVQLERVGYAIIESENNSSIIKLLWLHG
ncbi:MAG: glutamate--tRNA ligase [Candidatus Thalassarchaeaceae archaeon]|jgi:glutamyl-tRNA synthetase|nr:glutamate--tRNA ligase [Euryarchaeota archaeon]MDG1543320.1 glutamate--tRNA ligase [Candidatus Thalassarchaeaceae archaeon]|tara:strand:+ start:7255 stop:8976 length:1722 start_codon:yes stop_codon:yes gene_type:complete